jgi:hypothetical protein
VIELALSKISSAEAGWRMIPAKRASPRSPAGASWPSAMG